MGIEYTHHMYFCTQLNTQVWLLYLPYHLYYIKKRKEKNEKLKLKLN